MELEEFFGWMREAAPRLMSEHGAVVATVVLGRPGTYGSQSGEQWLVGRLGGPRLTDQADYVARRALVVIPRADTPAAPGQEGELELLRLLARAELELGDAQAEYAEATKELCGAWYVGKVPPLVPAPDRRLTRAREERDEALRAWAERFGGGQ